MSGRKSWKEFESEIVSDLKRATGRDHGCWDCAFRGSSECHHNSDCSPFMVGGKPRRWLRQGVLRVWMERVCTVSGLRQSGV